MVDKVYLVYMDNGEDYQDYQEKVEYVFSSNEKASMWLIGKGFAPYCAWYWNNPHLKFVKKTVDWHGDNLEFGAWIDERNIAE